jgi:type I restriction enzyme R subunit
VKLVITRGKDDPPAMFKVLGNKNYRMIAEALKSDGVEEIFKLGEGQGEIDIFDDDYLNKISKIKLANTKIMMLQKMLAKAIGDMKKVNLAQGIDFT